MVKPIIRVWKENKKGETLTICGWENERTNKTDGSKFKVISYDIQRSVVDKSDPLNKAYFNFKSFSDDDLLIISELCRQANDMSKKNQFESPQSGSKKDGTEKK